MSPSITEWNGRDGSSPIPGHVVAGRRQLPPGRPSRFALTEAPSDRDLRPSLSSRPSACPESRRHVQGSRRRNRSDRDMMRFAGFACVAALAAGCHSATSAGGPLSATCQPTTDSIQQTIFAPKCAGPGCHGTVAPSLSLDLVSPGVIERLAGAMANGCGNEVLVVPGAPDRSYLIEKLALDPPTCGERMPQGSPALSAEDLTCLRDWIAALPPVDPDAGTVPPEAGAPDASLSTCPTGQALCGGSCIDVQGDNQNCGACGTICGGGTVCTSGACTCAQSGQVASLRPTLRTAARAAPCARAARPAWPADAPAPARCPSAAASASTPAAMRRTAAAAARGAPPARRATAAPVRVRRACRCAGRRASTSSRTHRTAGPARKPAAAARSARTASAAPAARPAPRTAVARVSTRAPASRTAGPAARPAPPARAA
jgi:hypothetical protein